MLLNDFKKVLILIATAGMFSMSGLVFALDDSAAAANMTGTELYALIQQADPQNSLKLAVTPEVLAKINHLRFDEKARAEIHEALLTLDQHKKIIQTALKNQALPNDLLVLPLVENGTGLWHLERNQAKKMGLVINGKRDDRLNEKLATTASVNYLKNLYTQFDDWKLALIAYQIGSDATQKLIDSVGSEDPWSLARSQQAPKNLINYLALLDASVIIMHNPVLIAGS